MGAALHEGSQLTDLMVVGRPRFSWVGVLRALLMPWLTMPAAGGGDIPPAVHWAVFLLLAVLLLLGVDAGLGFLGVGPACHREAPLLPLRRARSANVGIR